ncbi:OmpA family protein [Tenacibaculum sp. M341]|uniref:OmpA family protein n=1 Tax=Tenacibaculum sp. M341 TaxID=2530339 RepID=UPI001053B502|nr:OmpA family protein [Tenacibaculum sp. M341]TCI92283.1 hypothetical protein EYW44_08870 [Tenacibaculum sp. M341]
MSKKLLYLIGILAVIILGIIFSLKYCCCPLCGAEATPVSNENEKLITKEVYKEPTLYPFSVKDGQGDLSLQINDNFNFEESNLNFLKPISSNLDMQIDKLKDYLTSNDNKSLSITGFFTANEKNNSAFPNLGIARANSVKNYFESKGIPSKIMNTFGQEKNGMVADSLKVYHGPVNFNILEFKDDSDEIAKLGEYIKANPIVLNFKTGQAHINLTAAERQEIADIAKYLDKVEGATCIVTGHTDNTGDATVNMKLGQDRADFAKQYLVRNAIPASKITAISKGQTEPIADNNTDEGKAKNRRTVITIK